MLKQDNRRLGQHDDEYPSDDDQEEQYDDEQPRKFGE
jgi:hypothetical protein